MVKERSRSSIKALVIGEFVHDDKSKMMTAVGAYKDVEKAYGAAYFFLVSDLEEDGDDGKGCTLTKPWRLEGDTGFGITMKNIKGETERRVYVLMNDEQEDEG